MEEPSDTHCWSRRQLLKAVPAAVAGGIMGGSRASAVPASSAPTPVTPASGQATRAYWIGLAERLARPVLGNLAKHTLKANLPAERNNTNTWNGFS